MVTAVLSSSLSLTRRNKASMLLAFASLLLAASSAPSAAASPIMANVARKMRSDGDNVVVAGDAPQLLPTTTVKPYSSSSSAEAACDQGNISALEPWERVLIEDFADSSSWGRLCFDTTQGASDAYAQVSECRAVTHARAPIHHSIILR